MQIPQWFINLGYCGQLQRYISLKSHTTASADWKGSWTHRSSAIRRTIIPEPLREFKHRRFRISGICCIRLPQTRIPGSMWVQKPIRRLGDPNVSKFPRAEVSEPHMVRESKWCVHCGWCSIKFDEAGPSFSVRTRPHVWCICGGSSCFTIERNFDYTGYQWVRRG